MKTFKTMLKVEMKLSLRGMDMVIFAICMPLVMVVLLGIIYGSKPAYEGAQYTFLEQSFGAVSTIAVCAGGVMGLPLLVSDYRHKKILKRFQVTPVSPAFILAVHVVIYTLYSVISLMSVYAVSKLAFKCEFGGSFWGFIGSYLLVMLSVFSIGMMIGGLAPDSKTAGVAASIIYFPMLIFSGATLPYEVMPEIMQKIVSVLPLTQGIKLLKATALGQPVEEVWTAVIVLGLVMLLCTGIGIKFFRWE